MRQKLAFCCAGLLCLLAACTDKGESLSPGQQGGICIIGSADGFTSLLQTRTQVGEVADDGALLIEWSANDCIGVFGDGSDANACFTGSNAEPALTTAFSGTLTGGGMPAYAYYPYQEGIADMTAIPVEIPAEQMYTDEGSVARYDFKASSDIVADPSGGYRVQFRQLAALVRFEIDLTGVQDLADDELLLDVTIHPANQENAVPMTGTFTYDLTKLDEGLQPGDATTDGLTLRFTYPPTAREKAIAYAVVAPGNHEGEEWTCTFTTDRQQGKFTTTALCDFEAGKYYTVPLTAEVLANNETVIEDIPEAKLEETANCYIVTEPGEHSFKATVIGNGAKGIIPDAGFHTDTPYINPKSAGLVWSESQNFITDVRLENGRVYYTVGDSYSNNGIIAVYSESNCQGKILWSWHIWGTIGEPEDEEYTNQAGAKFMVMDRELGAVRVAQYGCLYQWGRKDPFPNNVVTRYWNGTELVSFNTNFGWSHIKIDDATIQDAIQHPMELIAGNATSQYNWMGEDNFYLWGDANRLLPDDLSSPEAGAGWNQQKTIYDPSPVGYRVANIFTFSGFTNCTTGTNADVENGKLSYINYVRAIDGTDLWYFKKNADDTEGVPYQDIRARDGREGYQKRNAGYGGYWWSAEAYAGADRAYACYLKTDQYRQGSDSYNEINTYGRGYLLRDAYAIRCVREE